MIDVSQSSPRINYQDASSPAEHWDVVFTCFEPLNNVTGGIGSYHRLLINELAKNGSRQLILTRKINADWTPPEGVKVFLVDSFISTKPYNFVGLEHEHFSLHCHFAFEYLFNKGHRFNFVEFSDYGSDGFYPLRARAAGIYDFGQAAVRLHSPKVMLIEDNGNKHNHVDQYHRDVIDRELSAYDDCDVILYGGDAMRDRVQSLAEKFGYNLLSKMKKCPHPYPKHLFLPRLGKQSDNSAWEVTINSILKENRLANRETLESARFVGIFGRIEDRKGQYQFISGLLDSTNFINFLKESNVHFLIAGHNVLDHLGNFRLSDLYRKIFDVGLSDRFHFTGRVSQDLLANFSHAASGYIFPSIFENYPNALLEVLPTTKPIAISRRGCMPEIVEGFSNVTLFDPLTVDLDLITSFLRTLPLAGTPANQTELAARIATLEYRQSQMLEHYTTVAAIARTAFVAPQSVGFVVPVYQTWKYLDETLYSITTLMRLEDRIVVVDDGSDQDNLSEIQRICDKYKVELLVMSRNGGPSAARLHGARHLDTNLIQFCDADDLLDSVGIGYARQAFANDPDLHMVTGIMSCFQDANHYWVPRNGHVWTAVEAHFAHSGSMFRKSAILRALDHDRLPIIEDWLTSLLILAHGGKARMIPCVTYYYRRFDGTRSTENTSLIGMVQKQIIMNMFENWSFARPSENARLRELLVSYIPAGSSSSIVSAGHFPLRYRIVDSIFFRVIRNPSIERLMINLKRKWLSNRSRNRNDQ